MELKDILQERNSLKVGFRRKIALFHGFKRGQPDMSGLAVKFTFSCVGFPGNKRANFGLWITYIGTAL